MSLHQLSDCNVDGRTHTWLCDLSLCQLTEPVHLLLQLCTHLINVFANLCPRFQCGWVQNLFDIFRHATHCDLETLSSLHCIDIEHHLQSDELRRSDSQVQERRCSYEYHLHNQAKLARLHYAFSSKRAHLQEGSQQSMQIGHRPTITCDAVRHVNNIASFALALVFALNTFSLYERL